MAALVEVVVVVPVDVIAGLILVEDGAGALVVVRRRDQALAHHPAQPVPQRGGMVEGQAGRGMAVDSLVGEGPALLVPGDLAALGTGAVGLALHPQLRP